MFESVGKDTTGGAKRQLSSMLLSLGINGGVLGTLIYLGAQTVDEINLDDLPVEVTFFEAAPPPPPPPPPPGGSKPKQTKKVEPKEPDPDPVEEVEPEIEEPEEEPEEEPASEPEEDEGEEGGEEGGVEGGVVGGVVGRDRWCFGRTARWFQCRSLDRCEDQTASQPKVSKSSQI